MATTKTVRIRHVLNKYQLAALMKNGAEDYFGDTDSFEICRKGSGRDYNPMHVRGAVIAGLRSGGERSVDCGPAEPWEDDAQEAWYLRQVCLAYDLDQ